MSDARDSGPGDSGRGADRAANALVVYGSSSGGTAKVAEAVTEGLQAGGAAASSIRMDRLEMAPGRVKTADLLGIGSPVYFLREPGYVSRFLSELPPLDGVRAFVFCTCGMNRVGETLERLQAGLTERGAVVVDAQHFQSAMSYYPHRKRGLGNPSHLPDEAELAEARAFGERLARPFGLPPMTPKPVSKVTRWKAALLANRGFRQAVFPGVDLEISACTGYGSCLSRCLFEGIDRVEGEEIPFYTSGCVQCLECIAWCPREAIRTDSRFKEVFSTLSYRLGLH